MIYPVDSAIQLLNNWGQEISRLRSKHFRGVSEQKKSEERDFEDLAARKIGREQFAARKMGREQEMREGGGGEEGRKRLQKTPGF